MLHTLCEHLLAVFSAKVGREDYLKYAVWIENLLEINSGNGVNMIRITTSMTLKSRLQRSHTLGRLQVRNPTVTQTMKNGVFCDITPCGSCKNRLLHEDDKNH
jgi:hypothetical protein